MQHIQKAFSLLELMIVVAIIGILAAVAIPAYQDYTTRAQMTEVMTVLGSFKSPVAAYYAKNGTFPSKTELLSSGVVKLPTRYVADILVATAMDNEPGLDLFTMAAVISATGVIDKVKNKMVFLSTPDGGKTWLCHNYLLTVQKKGFEGNPWGGKGALEPEDGKYLPPNCRGGYAAAIAAARGG